jgi:signal transduction histidine kinase
MPEDGLVSIPDALDDAPCGYVTALPNGMLLAANRTFLSWVGLDLQTATQRKLQQFLTAAGRIYYDTHVGPLLQMQGAVREIACEIARPGADAKPVLMNAVLTQTEPRQLKVLFFDSTDRRRYEQELLRARRIAEGATQTEREARDEAERANRAKDDVLALVSHELRTPISAILGWAQVLRKKANADPDIERVSEVIERNTKLLGRLVDDLLDMSRIVSGKLRLDVQRVELADAIDAALETVQAAALAREVRLVKVLDPSVVVAGDPGRLQQVFWNLLSNAVKFTPKGGAVTVSMQRINSHVEVRLRDTGQGMSAEILGHVFERFRQSRSEGTRQTAGLGLGLSLVRHLVEMHGGSVEAHSAGEGQGSTFIVKLPVLAVDSAARVARQNLAAVAAGGAAGPAISLGGIRVLVVEDDRDARELLWRVLTDAGAEVVAASSAAEALGAIQRVQPHVLVSDIGLPGDDGYELIRSVRMLGGVVGRAPAIALTAMSRLEDRTQALLAGYQLHLAKPVDASELVVTVASLAGRIAPP